MPRTQRVAAAKASSKITATIQELQSWEQADWDSIAYNERCKERMVHSEGPKRLSDGFSGSGRMSPLRPWKLPTEGPASEILYMPAGGNDGTCDDTSSNAKI